ncbi:FAD dependent oxidoreductase superfamily [Grosmannia clavigera kw1407]|uniref:FAD dependent oxidoreductase superfamily n=1 Tax=Grosmannia clavigera (strain kw1407 / UAMH 11150) TaxID=655863 RepID=F0XQH3_GROCL|nr:FAD dependent oxidoreductase superfamily [Grosmannia clavigera kw1407]EFX00689.1 FAD dependent oxidoreductase superfamily [Grosmannia clavigera kw1407]
MDERARIPVTLPRDGPTKPFWQDPPDAAIADLQSTPELPKSVDIVIVGSGITGTSIAWHLMGEKEVGTGKGFPSILMLEARQACSGATGRNGGHTKAASYRSFLDHAEKHGMGTAVQIAQLELDGIRAVHAMATGEGGMAPIACDALACETVDIIYDPAQWTTAQKAVAAMRAALPEGDAVADYTLYNREEALAAFPCSDDGVATPICGAVRYAAGSVSAYRLVVGVLKRCLAGGLNLQTHTPALKLERTETDLWSVQTARGTVTARHVVVATNGYSAFLMPRLQGVVVPLRGQITMHRPGAAMPGGGSLETTYSFIYADGYEYMITRPPGSVHAGDMVIGGGLKFAGGHKDKSRLGLCEYGTTDDTTLNPAVSAYLRETPVRYFGGRDGYWGDDHVDGRLRAEWTGIMGYTPDGLPLVGAMPPSEQGASDGLWLCCAFQGHGMVFSWLCGRAAATMVQGRDDAELRRWFPDCFRVREERLKHGFVGRLHVSAKTEESKQQTLDSRTKYPPAWVDITGDRRRGGRSAGILRDSEAVSSAAPGARSTPSGSLQGGGWSCYSLGERMARAAGLDVRYHLVFSGSDGCAPNYYNRPTARHDGKDKLPELRIRSAMNQSSSANFTTSPQWTDAIFQAASPPVALQTPGTIALKRQPALAASTRVFLFGKAAGALNRG